MHIVCIFGFPSKESAVIYTTNNDGLEVCGSEIHFLSDNNLIAKNTYFLRADPHISQLYLNLLKELPKKSTREDFKNLINTYNIIYAGI